MSDLRPRVMLGDQLLWSVDILHGADYDPVFAQLPGALLAVKIADLMDFEIDQVDLHIGSRLIAADDGWSLTDGLRVSCRKRVLNAPCWVAIELPEGGCVVWEWDQVEELLRRRFQFLETAGATPADAQWPFV